MMMLPFFRLMAEHDASDTFYTGGAPVQIKIDGVLRAVGDKVLGHEQVQQLAYSLMDSDETARFERDLEMNFARQAEGLGNFRVNLFRQRGQVAMVVRRIAPKAPNLDELNLPQSLQSLVGLKRGLIVVAGATGSGKSSTVAALIEQRKRTQSGHILTVEDPVEYLFEHGRSIVNQREIGLDTHSYGAALKNAMREAPDVLMIGEIRDAETLTHAINYAQSGHLCITTFHASNSYHMLNRMISFFPPQTREALLMDLSQALKAVISQRLLPSTSGKLIPAVELMLNTPHIGELIRAGEIDKIKDAIEATLAEGAQTFEQALFRLYNSGQITLDEAMKNADSPTNLYWLVNNNENAKRPSAGTTQEAAPDFDGFILNQ